MKGRHWFIGAVAGFVLLFAGIGASAIDLAQNEERSRGSAGITVTGVDAKPANWPAEIAGITARGADFAPHDRHLYLDGISVQGAE